MCCSLVDVGSEIILELNMMEQSNQYIYTDLELCQMHHSAACLACGIHFEMMTGAPSK